MTNKAGTGTMAYNERNQLTTLTRENGQQETYHYDANGNQTDSGVRMVTWTAANKASQVIKAANVTEYQYDANQNRVVQVIKDMESTETTWYIGGGYEHVSEQRNGQTVEKLRFNLYAGDVQVGVYIIMGVPAREL